MNGMGIIRGLVVPIRHLIETYIEDIRWWGKSYYTPEGIARRSSSKTRGIFTVQYPEEKIPVPEEFRFLPFLVYTIGSDGERKYRCTACGICSKVCPPQCIWIERKVDPETGKPVTESVHFSVDVDICMNCGFCAEYCPFDAIKMDHDYEIATYSRATNQIYNKEKLGKPLEYYAKIRPLNFSREEAERLEKESRVAKKADA